MTDDLYSNISKLKFTIAISPYPSLESLKYLREYNQYVERNLGEKVSEVNTVLNNDSGEARTLNLNLIEAMANDKMYNSFENIMRTSLLMATYSTIERIVTSACLQKKREEYLKYKKNKANTKGKDILTVANEFLYKKGFENIYDIDGWDFIDDMREIRNRFVHYGGEANKEVRDIASKYDLKIYKNQIYLGENFIEKFISVIEKVAIDFAKVVFSNQGA